MFNLFMAQNATIYTEDPADKPYGICLNGDPDFGPQKFTIDVYGGAQTNPFRLVDGAPINRMPVIRDLRITGDEFEQLCSGGKFYIEVTAQVDTDITAQLQYWYDGGEGSDEYLSEVTYSCPAGVPVQFEFTPYCMNATNFIEIRLMPA